MSSTQQTITYTVAGSSEGTTPGGTSYQVNIDILVNSGGDFADTDAFAVQQAIIAAFPTTWGVTDAYIPVRKQNDTLVQYATDYTAKTFS